ncbi:MAG: hypothetical protein QXY73_04065 [Candidatus Bathyarchaeia archaeon]
MPIEKASQNAAAENTLLRDTYKHVGEKIDGQMNINWQYEAVFPPHDKY